MIRVEDNDALATHIINALPERVTWFGWLFHSWAPRLAMIAIVVTAGLVWSNRRSQPMAPAALPMASAPTVSTPTALVVAAREVVPNRTKPVEPLELLEPLEPARVDHERSLPPIAAVAALDIDSLIPTSLPEDAPLTLQPLVIADLPLASVSTPPM